MRRSVGALAALGLSLLAPRAAHALNYNETSGDLSTDPAAPTPLVLSVGSNIITGSVTANASNDARDYFTFTLPAGQRLTNVRLLSYVDLPGGTLPGNRGFTAINAGATSFIPSSGTSASFLGGDHLEQLPSGTDILPGLADGATAGTGFTVPLGAGTYTYLVQQTGPQISGYSLELVVGATPSSVPAQRPWALALLAGALVAVASRRHKARRPSS